MAEVVEVLPDAESGPSPIQEAAAKLRREAQGTPKKAPKATAPKPKVEASAPAAPEQEADPEPESAPSGPQLVEDEPAAEPEAEEVSAEGEPAPEAITVAFKGARGDDLEVSFPKDKQEFADALRHHLKRSADPVNTPEAEKVIQDLKAKDALATFIETEPEAGMHLIEKNAPEVASQFVLSWMQRHPAQTVKLLQDAKLADPDPEKLSLRAQAAQREADDRLNKGYASLTTQRAKQEFDRLAYRTISQAAEPLQLTDEEAKDFTSLATSRVVSEIQKIQAAGRDPLRELDAARLLQLCQSLAPRFRGAPVTAPMAKTPLPGEAQEQVKAVTAKLERRATQADTLRKIKRGAESPPPSGQPKFKPGTDLKSAIDAIRTGGVKIR